jgi:hypothetical protein
MMMCPRCSSMSYLGIILHKASDDLSHKERRRFSFSTLLANKNLKGIGRSTGTGPSDNAVPVPRVPLGEGHIFILCMQ